MFVCACVCVIYIVIVVGSDSYSDTCPRAPLFVYCSTHLYDLAMIQYVVLVFHCKIPFHGNTYVEFRIFNLI